MRNKGKLKIRKGGKEVIIVMYLHQTVLYQIQLYYDRNVL